MIHSEAFFPHIYHKIKIQNLHIPGLTFSTNLAQVTAVCATSHGQTSQQVREIS